MKRIFFTDDKNKLANERKVNGLGLYISDYVSSRDQLIINVNEIEINGSTKKKKVVKGDRLVIRSKLVEVDSKSNNKDILIIAKCVVDDKVSFPIMQSPILTRGSSEYLDTEVYALVDFNIDELDVYFELTVFG